MEVAPPQSGLAHVMRHSFKPSDHLAIALENYLQPGVTRPRIFLHATRLIGFMDDVSASEVATLYSAINKEFTKRHREKLFLGGSASGADILSSNIVTRKLGNGVLRVYFTPSSQEQLRSYLSGFDQFLATDSQESLPHDFEYLYADLPPKSLNHSGGIERNTTVMSESLISAERARLFYVSPQRVGLDRVPAQRLGYNFSSN